MVILFQLALFALVLMSFVLVVYVPVAYASPQDWDQSKRLILFGSIIWGVLVVVVGGLNYFVGINSSWQYLKARLSQLGLPGLPLC